MTDENTTVPVRPRGALPRYVAAATLVPATGTFIVAALPITAVASTDLFGTDDAPEYRECA